jgi:hypothetical protein
MRPVLLAALALAASTSAHASTAVICYAADPGYEADVKLKVQQTGLFSVVDDINCQTSTPSTAQLGGYDSVLVYSDAPFADATTLGNHLADYVDQGGGVVEAIFALAGAPLAGRYTTGGYSPLNGTLVTSGVVLTLAKDDPGHQILDNVVSFNGGSSSYEAQNATVAAQAHLVAHWSNGVPLIATLESHAGRTASLNFYPPSSDSGRVDFWKASTDGDWILGNALAWAGGISVDTDGDGVTDSSDNCISVPNADQADADQDGNGDACDTCDDAIDVDNDGIGDACDPCPLSAANDSDLDTVCDDVDQCPGYDDRADADGDLLADGCDTCPKDAAGADDTDADGACNSDDLCPGGDDFADLDADNRPDACDDCPVDVNPRQEDVDGDGYGTACDCDDTTSAISPTAPELCNEIDDNCDGEIDGAGAIGPIQWFEDNDGDGQGAAGTLVNGCAQPDNTSTNNRDCDDANPLVYEGAAEWCDGRDTNCNGEIDEGGVCPEATPTDTGANSVTSCGGCDGSGGATPIGAWVALAAIALVRRRTRPT